MTRIHDADNFMREISFRLRHEEPAVEIYRVGGSVRDEVLGIKPKDADYVVRNLTVEQLWREGRDSRAKVSKLQLRDGRVVGARFSRPGLGLIEVALPRTEVSTGPLHTDFEIITDPALSLGADAERRDFTINALYRNVVDGEIFDPLGGRHHLSQMAIHTTHPDSFRDDPLRILRGLRFVSQLPGFILAADTYNEMLLYASAVTGLTDKGVSQTASDELAKILMGDRAAIALRWMRDAGVMAHFLPELAPMLGFEQRSQYHTKTTDEHTFDAIDAAVRFHASLSVRMALLFHDAGKPESSWVGPDGRQHYYSNGETEDHEIVGARLADEALRRLPHERRFRTDVVTLVRRHMVSLSGSTRPIKVRQWRAELGDDLLRDLLKMRLADVIGKSDTVDEKQIRAIARLETIREAAERAHVPKSPADLAINGHDLMALGFQGRAIGEAQRKLLHDVLAQPKLNNREWLLAAAERIKP